MFLSTTVCWFDVRRPGQTHGWTDDQNKAAGGEGPHPPPWLSHCYNHIQSSISVSANTCWSGGDICQFTHMTSKESNTKQNERNAYNNHRRHSMLLMHTLPCYLSACPSIWISSAVSPAQWSCWLCLTAPAIQPLSVSRTRSWLIHLKGESCHSL